MLDIEIKTIPHNKQRYCTCGDYWDKGKRWVFRIDEMDNWRFEVLVAVHELIERAIVKHQGVEVKAVDAFDINFEAEREDKLHTKDAEPGDDPRAPYYLAHQFATWSEFALSRMLGVNWKKYSKFVLDGGSKCRHKTKEQVS